MQQKKQSVGGIWKRATKNGKEVLSITIGEQRYTAWLNDFKKDKQPDYKIYVDDYKPTVNIDNENNVGDLPF